MQNIYFFPFLVLRSPANSYEEYDTVDIRHKLSDSLFRSAIFIASKTLYNELVKNDFELDHLDKKSIFSLQKYLNRIHYRPTPFGLFSTFSTIKWKPTNNPICVNADDFHVHANLSFETSKLLATDIVQNELAIYNTYKVNSSIYHVGSEIRFLKSEVNAKDNKRYFGLESMLNKPIINNIIKYCKKERSKSEIINFINDKTDFPHETVKIIVESLIDSQLLVSSLGPNITGQDYLSRILNTCKQKNINDLKTQAILENIIELSLINESSNKFSRLITIQKEPNQIANFPNSLYVNTERFPINEGLSAVYQKKISSALHCLNVLIPKQKIKSLSEFTEFLMKRFEGMTIPLMVALDPEVEFSYDNSAETYINDESFEPVKLEKQIIKEKNIVWSEVHSLLLKKWKSNSLEVISISEEDIKGIKAINEVSMPPTFSVIFRIVNDKVYIEQAGGVTATSLLGRFTSVSNNVKKMAQDIAQFEIKSNKHALIAEINHLCEDEIADINRRDFYYDYEIPLLTHSVADQSQQILLSDLWVSVEQGKIVLWSKKNKKIVIPRLSSAYNYSRSDLSVFRFLCDLLHQEHKSDLSFNLSYYLPGLVFYPRVEYCSVIIHLATWYLDQTIIDSLITYPEEQRYSNFLVVADKLNLPRYFALTQNDNQIVFKRDSTDDIELFIECIKNAEKIIIKEYLMENSNSQLLVDTEGKKYVNQFIASIYTTSFDSIPNQAEKEKFKSYKTPDRMFAPGSNWLYLKLYCHPNKSNELLVSNILPTIKKLQRYKLISDWFYVRFRDPHYHIRLRIYFINKKNDETIKDVLKPFKKLVDERFISDMNIAVYHREIERYGISLINKIEYCFSLSSDLIITYIKQKNDKLLSNNGLIFLSISNIFDSFDLDTDQRISLLAQLVSLFSKEFDFNKTERIEFDMKYRKMRKEIHETLKCSLSMHSVVFRKQLIKYMKKLNEIHLETITYPSEKRLTLIADIMHMHLNRIFIDEPRGKEFLAYYMMHKYYKSSLKIVPLN